MKILRYEMRKLYYKFYKAIIFVLIKNTNSYFGSNYCNT